MKSADKPGSVVDSHSSGTCVTTSLKRPTRIQCGPHLKDSYLVLLRAGFTVPRTVTSRAVRSYRTLSPLPAPSPWPSPRRRGKEMKALRRFAFCCTFRRFAPPRRYLALCPLEPGLSSPMHPVTLKRITQLTPERLSSQLRRAHYLCASKSTSKNSLDRGIESGGCNKVPLALTEHSFIDRKRQFAGQNNYYSRNQTGFTDSCKNMQLAGIL